MEKFLSVSVSDKTHPLFLFVFTSELSRVPEEVRGRARGQEKTSNKWVLVACRQQACGMEREGQAGVRGGEEEGVRGVAAVAPVAPSLLHPLTQ